MNWFNVNILISQDFPWEIRKLVYIKLKSIFYKVKPKETTFCTSAQTQVLTWDYFSNVRLLLHASTNHKTRLDVKITYWKVNITKWTFMNIYDPKILFSFTSTLNDHSLAKMHSFNRLSFECQYIFNNNIKHIVNL